MARFPGTTGPQGPEGIAGPAGEAGSNGMDGAPGINGIDGLQGEQGPPGLDGADGLPGMDGPQGPEGPQGETGPQGPTGAKGNPGTQAIITSDVEPATYVAGAQWLNTRTNVLKMRTVSVTNPSYINLLIDASFEYGIYNWTTRNSTHSISLSSVKKYTGSQSLYYSGGTGGMEGITGTVNVGTGYYRLSFYIYVDSATTADQTVAVSLMPGSNGSFAYYDNESFTVPGKTWTRVSKFTQVTSPSNTLGYIIQSGSTGFYTDAAILEPISHFSVGASDFVNQTLSFAWVELPKLTGADFTGNVSSTGNISANTYIAAPYVTTTETVTAKNLSGLGTGGAVGFLSPTSGLTSGFRNIFYSTSAPGSDAGANGDIWLVHTT